jgi:predicted phage terminase large subunit-like protein
MDTLEELRTAVKVDKQLLKDRFLSDLFFFNVNCLNVEKGKEKVPLGDFHKEMCEFVDLNPNRQKLLLVPRGHLKSTLVTIGKTLQWIAEDPSVRILIANATYNLATSFLTVIKRHLKQNPMYIDMFGDLATDAEKWSENIVTLKQAPDQGGEKEATVVCYGMSGQLTSQHYDKIILDDVVNDQTVTTRDQIEKTINFYRLCQPLLEKHGEMIIIGTRWDEGDLYGYIKDKENGLYHDFDFFERKAIDDDVWDGKKQEFVKGDVLWKEKYNLKDLSKVRRKMGPYHFSAQYQNDPVPPDDADFKRQWFKYYEYNDLKGADINRYTLIDPAISVEQTADYTAMVTVGIDIHKNIYVFDIVRERLKVDGIINAIFAQNERWHPQAIGIEEVGFQRAIRYALKQEEEKRKRYLNVIELKPHTRSKDQRIKALQPLYANGKVLHNRELIFNIYLEDELLRFPRGKHDDVIDALAYALDVVRAPQKKVTPYRRQRYLY